MSIIINLYSFSPPTSLHSPFLLLNLSRSTTEFSYLHHPSSITHCPSSSIFHLPSSISISVSISISTSCTQDAIIPQPPPSARQSPVIAPTLIPSTADLPHSPRRPSLSSDVVHSGGRDSPGAGLPVPGLGPDYTSSRL